MAQRVAEHVMRQGDDGPDRLYRVDLHGVSVFGPGDAHVLIRFEWIETIVEDDGDAGVTVSASETSITFPPGAFGLKPSDLAQHLEAARSIVERPDIIGALARR